MRINLDQLKAQANNIVIKIRALPTTVKTLPEEKLIAYGCIVFGLIFILLAIITW